MYRLTLHAMIVFTLAMLLALSIPAATNAATGPEGGATFSLRPVHYDPAHPETQSYFVLDLVAGAGLRNEVRVANTGPAAGTVRLYTVDATTGQNSGAVYAGRDSAPQDTGAWVTLDETELTLGPGEERLVGFSVRAPEGTRPGEHLGGIAAEGVTPSVANAGAGVQITMQTRTVVGVLVNIPGPRVDKVVIENIQAETRAGYQVLRIGLRNEGTHMARLLGNLDLADAAGHPLAQIPLKLDYLLPGTAISYPLAIPGRALAAGNYKVSLNLGFGEGGTAAYAAPLDITTEQVRELYEARGQELPAAPEGQTQSAPPQSALPLAPLLALAVSAALFTTYLLGRRRKAGH